MNDFTARGNLQTTCQTMSPLLSGLTWGALTPLAVCTVNLFTTLVLCGCGGCLTAIFGGFDPTCPGQMGMDLHRRDPQGAPDAVLLGGGVRVGLGRIFALHSNTFSYRSLSILLNITTQNRYLSSCNADATATLDAGCWCSSP